MKRGQILEDIHIEKLGYGWVGIATAPDGRKLLVKGALPHSVVDCKIIKKKKDYAQAHIVAVKSLDDSLTDGEVKCPHYLFPYHQQNATVPEAQQGCGGCKWQVMSYPAQLKLKQEIIEDCFTKYKHHAGEIAIQDILPSPQAFQYRNKIEFSFGKFLQRHVEGVRDEIQEHRQLGFHRQGMFSKIVDVDQCFLVSERMHQVYQTFKTLLLDSGLPVYDVKTHQGLLRHLVIREGMHTDQILVNLSVASQAREKDAAMSKLREKTLAAIQAHAWLQDVVTSLVLTYNNGLADIVRGQESTTQVLWGEGSIYEELHFENHEHVSTRFKISPFSFFQTNTWGAEVLFSTAADLLWEVQGNVIDLYCGSGSIGISLAKLGKGKKLIGIEIVEEAVKDAFHNAEINGITQQVDFLAGKAEKLVQDLAQESLFVGDDVIIVDPPRDGLHKDVVTFLNTLRGQYPFRLLYISCNPVTMVRDLLLLDEQFSLQHIQPVDMFPQTHHVEVVWLLN